MTFALYLGHTSLTRHFCECSLSELLKIILFINYWHTANLIYFMIFGCTQHTSSKLDSALVCTKIYPVADL